MDAPALHDLTVNPLLLTMIANVHRYRGALPGSRADLYAEICQVMLWRRQEAKNLAANLAGDKKERLLRELAYAMMQRQLRDLPRKEVCDVFRPALRRLPGQLTAEDFLTDAGSNGLLVERESGLYCFVHQTFQEYLAAAHILRDKGLASALAQAVDDPWWRETTLPYTAHADADPIVAACLESGTVTALALAFDCAEQGSEIAADLRGRLEDLLAEVSDPGTGQERRHLIAAVLLTRHLHQQIRTGSGARICARPVTGGLYRLFRDDTQAPAPDGMPSATAGTETAQGMRASDAAAFVRWVNDVIGGEPAYRLPGDAELDDPVVQRLIAAVASGPSAGVWIEPEVWPVGGHAAPRLWVPSGARHPHRIDAATLTAHVHNDITRSVPTLTRLILRRSAVRVRFLVAYLALARDRARARALAPARDRALAPALDLALDLNRARDLDRALALDRYPALNRARDLDRALALDRALDLERVLDLDRALNRGFAQVMGWALSQALTSALRRAADARAWPAEFSKEFAGLVDIADNGYLVSLDTLADKTIDAVQAFQAIVTSHSESAGVLWASAVAGRLRQTAVAVFDRREQLTPSGATFVRLAALCLAAEADAQDQRQLGDAFREIAVGITLLERRTSGDDPAPETILLATE
jgi:hypothetical protein